MLPYRNFVQDSPNFQPDHFFTPDSGEPSMKRARIETTQEIQHVPEAFHHPNFTSSEIYPGDLDFRNYRPFNYGYQSDYSNAEMWFSGCSHQPFEQHYCNNCGFFASSQQECIQHQRNHSYALANVAAQPPKLTIGLENAWTPPLIVPSSPTSSESCPRNPHPWPIGVDPNTSHHTSLLSTDCAPDVNVPEVVRNETENTDSEELNRSFLQEMDSQCESNATTKVRVYMCQNCSYTTQSRSSYDIHKKSHELECIKKPNGNLDKIRTVYYCKECDFKTNFGKAFKRHVNQHNGKNRYKCRFCSYSVNLINHLNGHEKMHHDKKQSIPQFECESKETMTGNHQVSFDVIRDKYMLKNSAGISCKVCGSQFQSNKSLNNLREHVYAKHLNIKPYACNTCSYKSSYITNMNRHKKKCAISKNNSKNDAIASEKTSVDFDQSSNQVENKFDARSKNSFKDDSSTSHAIKSSIDNKFEIEKLEKVLYQCTECDYTSKFEAWFHRHKECHSLKSRYTCQLCSYSAMFPYLIRTHSENHHKTTSNEISVDLTNIKQDDEIPNEKDEASFQVLVSREQEESGNFDENEDSRHAMERHYCSFCKFSSNIEQELKRHKIHHDNHTLSRFKCKTCSFTSNTKTLIEVHCGHHHEPGNRFNYEMLVINVDSNDPIFSAGQVCQKQQCLECDFTTSDLLSFQDHVEKHKISNPNKCPSCTFSVLNATEMLNHFRTDHHENNELSESEAMLKYNESVRARSVQPKRTSSKIVHRYKCQDCQFSSPKRSRYKKHRSYHSDNQFKFQCNLCSYSTNMKHFLQNHVNNHHNVLQISDKETKWQCSECDFFSTNNKYVQTHRNRHEVSYEFKCRFCSYSASQLRTVTSHQAKHHKMNVPKDEDFSISTDQKLHGFCDDNQSNGGSVEFNKKISRPYKMKKRFMKTCDKCNFATMNKQTFLKHLTRHQHREAFTCEKCDFSVSTKVAITFHSVHHHKARVLSEKHRYYCRKCEFVAKRSDQLRSHYKRHGAKMTFICANCDYSSPRKMFVKFHEENFHRNNCAALENSTVPSGMNSVENISPREDSKVIGVVEEKSCNNDPSILKPEVKQFQCPECDYSSNFKTSLMRHCRNHNRAPDADGFKCRLCSYSAQRQFYVVEHMKFHHAFGGQDLKYNPSLPMTPDSSERSGSESSTAVFPAEFPTPADKSNAEQIKLQASKVTYREKTRASVIDYTGWVQHHIPSTFSPPSALSPSSKSEVDRDTDQMKECLKAFGVYENKPSSKMLTCRFCPHLSSTQAEKCSHEKLHGFLKSASKEKQYQCPLCSFSSDTDIDLHLGFHLRLAEFHKWIGNEITDSLPLPENPWPVLSEVEEDYKVLMDLPENRETLCTLCGITVPVEQMEFHRLRHCLGCNYEVM